MLLIVTWSEIYFIYNGGDINDLSIFWKILQTIVKETTFEKIIITAIIGESGELKCIDFFLKFKLTN